MLESFHIAIGVRCAGLDSESGPSSATTPFGRYAGLMQDLCEAINMVA